MRYITSLIVCCLAAVHLGAPGHAGEPVDDSAVMHGLRHFYWFWEPVPPQLLHDEELHRRLEERGDPEALFLLAILLDDALEPVQAAAPDRAVVLLERAAARDYAPAKATLGDKLLRGDGLETDVERGRALVTAAVASDDAVGHLVEGMAYIEGTPPYERDLSAADAAMKRALAAGHPHAHYHLGLLARARGDAEAAWRHLRAGAKLGDPKAMDQLAVMLWREDGSQAARIAALGWAERVVTRHPHPRPRYNYARMLAEHYGGNIPEEVEELLMSAADGGVVDAIYLRGVLHVTGAFASSDPELGHGLLREAAAAGHHQAMRAVQQHSHPPG